MKDQHIINHLSFSDRFSLVFFGGGGGGLKEFLAGGVPLEPWNLYQTIFKRESSIRIGSLLCIFNCLLLVY